MEFLKLRIWLYIQHHHSRYFNINKETKIVICVKCGAIYRPTI